MLKSITIADIVLIDKTHILFQKGFNVISGETGAGKSVIMDALGQIMGQRTDNNLVRLGASKGTVEAVFDIIRLPILKNILDQAGIECEDDDLIIKKEISTDGRSRIFINNQQSSGAILKKIGGYLLQIVGQHAKNSLFEPSYHLELVDLYGNTTKDRNDFANLFAKEKEQSKGIEQITATLSERLQLAERLKSDLQEISEANLKEGEEEELFIEYSRLSNIEELRQLTESLENGLGDSEGALAILRQQQKNCDDLIKLDSGLQGARDALHSIILELQELSYTIGKYAGRLEADPARCLEINEKLTTINSLKKKYGRTVSELIDYQKNLPAKIADMENTSDSLDDLKEQNRKTLEELSRQAKELSVIRRSEGEKFASLVTSELQSLNMGGANFSVSISPKERSSSGDDHLEFFICPNIGEKTSPLTDSASGGELSRIMLAIKTVLSKLDPTPTIIFDEIDANVGGQTAAVLGKKLKFIGENRQVLCITHFPQVAELAHHHIKISKDEKNGRTFTSIVILDKPEKEIELRRMVGKC